MLTILNPNHSAIVESRRLNHINFHRSKPCYLLRPWILVSFNILQQLLIYGLRFGNWKCGQLYFNSISYWIRCLDIISTFWSIPAHLFLNLEHSNILRKPNSLTPWFLRTELTATGFRISKMHKNFSIEKSRESCSHLVQ